MRKGKRYPAEILTDVEACRLMRICSNRAPTGIRNRAMIVLMYRAGLRVSEVLDLYRKDVDLDECTVRVLHGKGDQARTVGMDEGAAAVVARWCDRRGACGLNGRHRLFATLAGNPVSQQYVGQLLHRLAARAGIEKRVHPHGLRHSHAAQLRAEGIDIGVISKQLGHRSIAATNCYLDHIAPTAVLATMRARSWSL